MSEELKPCPFCGGDAHIQTFHFRCRALAEIGGR